MLDRCVQYIYYLANRRYKPTTKCRFFSLADIAFQGSCNVKYSAVIIILITIFLHHHVRESSSCADETRSLHGAAESFYPIVIVELVFILIVNFQRTILS